MKLKYAYHFELLIMIMNGYNNIYNDDNNNSVNNNIIIINNLNCGSIDEEFIYELNLFALFILYFLLHLKLF